MKYRDMYRYTDNNKSIILEVLVAPNEKRIDRYMFAFFLGQLRPFVFPLACTMILLDISDKVSSQKYQVKLTYQDKKKRITERGKLETQCIRSLSIK